MCFTPCVLTRACLRRRRMTPGWRKRRLARRRVGTRLRVLRARAAHTDVRVAAAEQARAEPMQQDEEEPAPLSTAIVLAEDKKYYPSAEEVRVCAACGAPCALLWLEAFAAAGLTTPAVTCRAQVYGAGTETLVMDEDAQTLEARARTRAAHRRRRRRLGLAHAAALSPLAPAPLPMLTGRAPGCLLTRACAHHRSPSSLRCARSSWRLWSARRSPRTRRPSS